MSIAYNRRIGSKVEIKNIRRQIYYSNLHKEYFENARGFLVSLESLTGVIKDICIEGKDTWLKLDYHGNWILVPENYTHNDKTAKLKELMLK